MADDRIALENLKPGTARSIWDAAASNQIEGFATDISIDNGETVQFKINVNAPAGTAVPYRIEIYRLGYYGGDGATFVTGFNTTGSAQPDPITDGRGLVDAGNWTVSAQWATPENAVSGVYLAKLQRLDGQGNPIDGATNQIPFIVRQDELRSDGTRSDILLQTSDTTWHAYNGWGGNNGQIAGNFYGGFDQPGSVPDPGLNQDRSYAVSYNRPFTTRDGGGAASGAQDYLFGADYAAIHWLEQNGYDVSYISGVDTDRLGADYLKAHKAFISVGHDEYWSGGQRDNVEAARDAGVNLLFWSGNEVYWKTRWEDAISADGTPYRTLVSYKETWANRDPNAAPSAYANIDPSNEWTGTWRDLRFTTSTDANGNLIAQGAEPENALTGQLFGPDGTGEFGAALDIPASFAGLRVWRDTGVPSTGQLDLAPGILGYEWNTSPEDAYRPEGLIKLSETTVSWSGILTDQGNTTAPGIATHNLSLYRAESGALVFGAGTVFWTWALSDEHDSSPYGAQIESQVIKQFTVNMFADMQIQPAVADAILASQGLVRATASNDFTPASAGLVDLPDTIPARQTLLITGTATDNDGNPAIPDGVVAAVEVSVDGGGTWRVAEGTTNWSYAWRPTVEGTYNIRARAIDDSLNNTTFSVSQDTVTVTAAVTPETVSLFESAPVTAIATADGQAIELGMQFSVSEPGTITQIKYWRAETDAGDTDVREGRLWGQDGTLLATTTFNSAAGQSGWQVASLAAPVAVAPGVEYTVSYRTADNYVATNGFFAPANEIAFDGLDNNAFTDPFGKISAPQDETGDGNGVYRYGTPVVMPTEAFQSSNYWVDVTFDPAAGGTNQPPVFSAPFTFTLAENTAAVGTLNVSDADGTALTYGITGPDAARFAVNPTTRALSFTSAPDFEAPADVGADNVYNVVISASDGVAAPVAQAFTVTVTDAAETGPTGSRLFGSADAPTNFVGNAVDTSNYELGTKFSPTVDGQATVLQYFRGTADADDTDIRTMTLWTGSGSPLGTVSITAAPNQTGWQAGTLATPVALSANATYVVSYSYVANNGDGATESYAATGGYFTAARPGPDGVLIGLADGAAGGNGVFAVAGPGNFPTGSFNATNYWTDVLFTPGATPPTNTPPTFTSPATIVAAENQVIVGNVTATDPNAGQTLTYGIAGGVDGALFQIGASNGLLQFLAPQDYEAGDTVFNVTVSVSDGVAPAVTQELTVNLGDVNESVAGPAGFTGSTLTAEYIFGATPTTLFPGAGATQTAIAGAGIEFPNLPTPDLTNVGNGPFGLATADVAEQTIRVEFPLDSGQFSGFLAFASVADRPFNGVRIADTTSGLPTILGASIIGQQGFTNAAGALQPLTAADLTVTADGIFLNVAGKGRLVDVDSTVAGAQAANVTLLVDLNDAPVLQGGDTATSPVAENTTGVATLAATDADTSQAIAFSIVGGEDAALFQLSGLELRFIAAPNFESLPSDGLIDDYQVLVQAADAFGGVDTQTITVVVTDVGEGSVSAPADTNVTADAVAENAIAGTVVGITAQATDADAGDTVSYSLTNDADGRFVIGAATGVVTVAPGAVLDREAAAEHLITVRATSSDTSSADANFTIALGDVDEFDVTAPVDGNASANTVAENAAIGAVVGITAQATDADATTNAIAYSLFDSASGRFAINAATGVVTVAGALDFETAPAPSITVRATSADGSTADSVFGIAVTNVDEPGGPGGGVTIGSGPDSLVLKIAQDAYLGSAQYEISVDGVKINSTLTAVALQSSGLFDTVTVLGNWTGDHVVSVNFLNDAYGGSPATDRNLYVNGITFKDDAAAAPVVVSSVTTALEQAGPVSFAFADGALPPQPPPGGGVTIGSGPDSLVLKIAQDAYLGSAQYEISVDGVKINSTLTAVALQSSGLFDTVTVLGNWTGDHVVSVNFLNDAYGGSPATDRNLYVNGITFKDDAAAAPVVVSSVTTALEQAGPVSFAFADGALPPQPPPGGGVTIGSGPDSLVLKIAQDAYLGSAQYEISVDGVKINSTLTAVALQSSGLFDTVTVLGNWTGDHVVSVNFLNDAYGGSPATDRNLYVNGITFKDDAAAAPVVVSSVTTALEQAGPVSFAFADGALPPQPPPGGGVTIGSGPDSLVLKIAQDAYLGSAQYEISVDGVKINSTLTAVALQSSGLFDTVTVLGNWTGDHVVSVNFLNDAYGGSPATDRNLYVNGITFKDDAAAAPVVVSSVTTALEQAGAVSFAFADEVGASLLPLGSSDLIF